jgi:hypothetical protein
MNEQQILAAAEALAKQHQQDILDARANLVREAVEGGYNSDKWVICDNLVDIRAGTTLDYHCWLALRNPTEL